MSGAAPRELSPAASAVIEDAIAAVAQAASAARQAAEAASAAQARVAELEKSVAALRADNRRQAEDLTQIRDRADNLERAVIPLLLGSLVLALLAGWLAWRLRTLEKERQAAWKEAAKDVPRMPAGPPPLQATFASPPVATTPVPLVDLPASRSAATGTTARALEAAPPTASDDRSGRDSLIAPATIVAPRPGAPRAPSAPARTGAPAAAAQPAATPAPSVAAVASAVRDDLAVPDVPTRPVPPGSRHPLSIEELIDLEQQAEFFTVLGQDDSAVELLAEHIRGSGGSAPLPYLKLLEIHRRQGDREAYERMRTRFNQRFNAYAPEWGNHPDEGRSLEDHPEIIARVQSVWAQPLDAMADLEALMFGKSAQGTVFDLPAYRDVLLLYSVARDLLEHAGGTPQSIDVLLPLATEPAARNAQVTAATTGDTMPGGLPLIDERALADTRPLEFEFDLKDDSRFPGSGRKGPGAG